MIPLTPKELLDEWLAYCKKRRRNPLNEAVRSFLKGHPGPLTTLRESGRFLHLRDRRA